MTNIMNQRLLVVQQVGCTKLLVLREIIQFKENHKDCKNI